MTKGLSRAIGRANALGYWKGIQIQNMQENQTHGVFADDTLLLGHASIPEAKVIKSVIIDFSLALGQKINPSKSKNFLLNVLDFIQNKLINF